MIKCKGDCPNCGKYSEFHVRFNVKTGKDEIEYKCIEAGKTIIKESKGVEK
jgi:hypothetical protein